MYMFKSRSLAVYLGLIIFAADLVSKFLTQKYLPPMNHYLWYPYGGIGVFKNFLGIEFSISYLTNKGAAWGVLAAYQNYLIVMRIFLVLGVCIYAFFFNKHRSWEIPLTFIVVGAAGNILDFFIYGHVVDMLHFILWGYDFPVFNLADSAIFIGITLLMLISTFEKKGQIREY